MLLKSLPLEEPRVTQQLTQLTPQWKCVWRFEPASRNGSVGWHVLPNWDYEIGARRDELFMQFYDVAFDPKFLVFGLGWEPLGERIWRWRIYNCHPIPVPEGSDAR